MLLRYLCSSGRLIFLLLEESLCFVLESMEHHVLNEMNIWRFCLGME